jgi:hypothetical protein
VLERPEVRAVAIEMSQEGVRQRAVGWVDEGIPQSQLRLYPGEGHIPILDRPIKGSWRHCSPRNPNAAGLGLPVTSRSTCELLYGKSANS